MINVAVNAFLLAALVGKGHEDAVQADDPPTSLSRAAVLAKLLKPDEQHVNRLVSQLRMERVETVDALVKFLDSGRTDIHFLIAKTDAFLTLGEYRSANAVPFLIKDIEAEGFLARREGPLVKYPAAAALADIGVPSIDGIIHRLRQPVSEKELLLFAHVVHRIDGTEVGLFRLEASLRDLQQRPPKKRSTTQNDNLQRLIEVFKATDFTQYVLRERE